MATNQEKLVDLNGIAAVRDWANQKFSGGSGSGLPEVTSADNGDILSVVNGAWAKSEPGYRMSEVAGTEIVPEQSVTAEVGTSGKAEADIGPLPWNPTEGYPENVIVVIDGTKYALEKTSESSGVGVVRYDGAAGITFTYLAMDAYFTVYMPTSMAGTHTISISEPGTRDAIPTEDFKLAVNNSYMVTTESEKETIPVQSVTTAVQGEDSFAFGSVTNFTMPGEYDPTTFPNAIHVTFNGTEYDLPRTGPESYTYGAPWGDDGFDFTTYPIQVEYSFMEGVSCSIYTPHAGTYTLSATYTEATTAPTEKFKEAVRQSGGGGSEPFIATFTFDSDSMEYSCDKTREEIKAAADAGQVVMCDVPRHNAKGYYAGYFEEDYDGVTETCVLFFGATYASGGFAVIELSYVADGIYLVNHQLA